MKTYDLIVIGTGAGGAVAAHQCRKAGWSVAIIDKKPFGGTCALRGCDPKKVLVGAAEIIDRIDRMEGKGIVGQSRIDWAELMAFKATFTDPVPGDREKSYRDAGIDTYHGVASFVDEDRVEVNGEVLKGKHILVATGAKPRTLDVPGEEYLAYSADFLDMEELPGEIVFIGGGFISFEFAHIAARAGAKVHILHRSDQVLKHFDHELVDALVKRSEALGIHVHLNTALDRIEKDDTGYLVYGKKGESIKTFHCDRVFHGAGRVPDLEGLNLDKGKIRTERGGIVVDRYQQSPSNPIVYAAGDVTASPGLPLTPVASMESYVVATNLLEGNTRQSDYRQMPSVVFTQPKLAILGMTEEEAQEEELDFYVETMDTTEWYTYKRTNEPVAMVKILVNNETKELLGVHILADHADVLINHFTMIMRFDIPFNEVKKTIFAYPTMATDLRYLL